MNSSILKTLLLACMVLGCCSQRQMEPESQYQPQPRPTPTPTPQPQPLYPTENQPEAQPQPEWPQLGWPSPDRPIAQSPFDFPTLPMLPNDCYDGDCQKSWFEETVLDLFSMLLTLNREIGEVKTSNDHLREEVNQLEVTVENLRSQGGGGQSTRGEKGDSGADGFPGPPGPPGVSGHNGAPGWPGWKGARGYQGYTGYKGTKGDQGKNNLGGQKGESGSPGLPGHNGREGAEGPPGQKGEKGDTGANAAPPASPGGFNQIVAEKCNLPKDTGPCRAAFTKWYYYPTERSCQTFMYGGCGGNDNRFDTRESCEAECVPNVLLDSSLYHAPGVLRNASTEEKVAFVAYNQHVIQHENGGIVTYTSVPSSTPGNHMKPETGKFCAPVTGWYYFSFEAQTSHAHMWTLVQLMIGDFVYANAMVNEIPDCEMPHCKTMLSMSRVIHLKGGQDIWVQMERGRLEGPGFTYFSGFLLYRDQ